VTKPAPTVEDRRRSLHQALAQFRHQLRIFLLASEEASHRAGLHPQQHQLLLAVAGASSGAQVSIAYAADQLGLKHNTVVELVDRCEQEGLLHRTADQEDRRRVCLKISARGQQVLDGLSEVHLRELDSQAPHLIRALQNVLQNETKLHGKQQPKKNG
jgi:DNA-binding MarR family transcriptional regulator